MIAYVTSNCPSRWSGSRLAPVLALGLCGFGILIVGLLAFPSSGADNAGPDPAFKLREISIADLDKDNESFLRGQMVRCQTAPYSQVKHYPAFVSHSPVYGQVKFSRPNNTNSSSVYYFAVDESQGDGKGYDRFFFDLNQDLDLGNDPVLKLNPHPPDHGYRPAFSGIKSVNCFDFLNLTLASQAATNSVEIMPRLLVTGSSNNTYKFLFFVRTHVFQGRIRVGHDDYAALLGNDYTLTPDLNSPGTALKLNGPGSFDWWGGDRLSAMHYRAGQFYSFSTSQNGLLTIHLYQGDLGTFTTGPGTRNLPPTNFTLSGSLDAGKWAVAVGGKIQDGRPEAARSCQLPVGDYLPEFLTVQFGALRIQLSQNYHSEGKRQSREGRPEVYGIHIRKDQPYTFDFSNPPQVMFTSPTNQQSVKLGDEISVMAVLVDPQLDIMIRRLEDTARKQTKDAEGHALGYERNFSLDPKVIITRANGEKVAEGVMPFG